jgi:uncharacterized membrane protein YbhN (UPF0104 family)
VKPKWRKHFVTAIKIAISVGLITLVFRQLDWTQIRLMLEKANLIYFGMAVVIFVISQVISVFRFNLFIRKVGVRISFKTNAQLYLLGMFYNFFLPGGVGGDAYKAFALSKAQNKSLKRVGRIVFVERFLGIIAIGFCMCILVLFLPIQISYGWNITVCIIGILGAFVILQLVIGWLPIHRMRVYIGFFYSVMIQILQVLCVFFILKSFQVDGNYFAYFFMFLISSILSVISFAGLGIREFVFYYGAQYFDFNSDISASVALSFSIITAFVSFLGIIYLVKPIQMKKK